MKDPLWGSLAWRRQYIPDRRWFGMGAVIAGLFGGLLAPGAVAPWRAVGGVIAIVGLLLLRPWVADVIRMGRVTGPDRIGPSVVLGRVLFVIFVPYRLPWEPRPPDYGL